MRVTVFGASGKVGRIVVDLLLKDGTSVTAFVHNSLVLEHDPNLRIVIGDVYKLRDVKAALKGADFVISTLGSWGKKDKDVVSSGINNITMAMNEAKIKRVVSLTGAGAIAKGDKSSLLSRLSNILTKLSPIRQIIIDGEKHIQLLEESKLNWTVLRSPIMTIKGDPNSYTISERNPNPWATINRQSVAQALVELLSNKDYYKMAPYISRK